MPPREDRRIPLSQAVPGMVLAQAVALPNRITLCAARVRLNEQLIAQLMNRGVRLVHVIAPELPAGDQIDCDETIRRLRVRFDRVRQVPLMAEIEQMIERELVRRL